MIKTNQEIPGLEIFLFIQNVHYYATNVFFTILQILPDVCAYQDSTQFVPVWTVHSVLKQPENKHVNFTAFIQYYFVYLLKNFILLLKFDCNLLKKLKLKLPWNLLLT